MVPNEITSASRFSAAYATAIDSTRNHGSGAIPPEEVLEYVCEQTNVRSIVFGASSRGHIRQTKQLIDQLTGSY